MHDFPDYIPRKWVCCILIVQQIRRTEIGSTVQHWSLWEQNLVFAAILLILLLSTYSKREKVVFWSQ